MKKILTLMFVISALVPFGEANDFELIERCFVENHDAKKKVADLEDRLATLEAELAQYHNDYPGTATDTSAGAEELNESK